MATGGGPVSERLSVLSIDLHVVRAPSTVPTDRSRLETAKGAFKPVVGLDFRKQILHNALQGWQQYAPRPYPWSWRVPLQKSLGIFFSDVRGSGKGTCSAARSAWIRLRARAIVRASAFAGLQLISSGGGGTPAHRTSSGTRDG